MTDRRVNTPRRAIARPMAQVIPVVLIGGVGLSAAVLALGMLLLIATGRTGYGEAVGPALLTDRPGTVVFPSTLGAVLAGAVALRPFALIELGALLLIATPVVRVAASVILFWLEKDRLYTVVTLVVLLILLASFLGLG